MSDTPRTDALSEYMDDVQNEWGYKIPKEVVRADFARQLEREVDLLEQGVMTCPGGMEIIEELRAMRREYEEGRK